MSHKIKVSVALNIDRELNNIDAIYMDLDNCAGIHKEFLADELRSTKNKLDIAKEALQKYSDITVEDQSSALLKYQEEVDTVLKTIANIKSSINFGETYARMQVKDDESVNKIIASNGIMAMMAIQNLQDKGETVSEESLGSEIDSIRSERLSKERVSAVLDELEETILDIDIPEESKATLIEKSDTVRSPQEIMDLMALLKSHENAYKRMLDNADIFEKALIDADFVLSKRVDSVNEDGELILEIIAFKENSKEISVKLTSSMSASWQHGDYEYHMCKADKDVFLESLIENGIKYTSPVVMRTTSNNRPISRVMKLKEREM